MAPLHRESLPNKCSAVFSRIRYLEQHAKRLTCGHQAVDSPTHMSDIDGGERIVGRTDLPNDNSFEHLPCLWLPSDLLEWNRPFAPPASFQTLLNLVHEIGVRQHPPKHRFLVPVPCFALLYRVHNTLHIADKCATVSLPVSHAHSSERHDTQFPPSP